MFLTDKEIQDRIDLGNYYPSCYATRMTQADFEAKYGLAALQKLTRGLPMLYFLFGKKDQDLNSLTYRLEYKKAEFDYYGVAFSGSNDNKMLNCTVAGVWREYEKPITEDQAMDKAVEIRDSLVAILSSITPATTAIEIGAELGKHNFRDKQMWLKKYFTVLHPDKFMPMTNADWTNRIFQPLGLTSTGNWYEDSVTFCTKASSFGMNAVDFYNLIRTYLLEKIKAELTAEGIDFSQFEENDLLINSEKAWMDLSDRNDEKARLRPFFEKKYGWPPLPAAPVAATTVAGGTASADVAGTTASTPAGGTITYLNPYSNTLITSRNVIFRGAPGTGKSHLAKEIAADIVSGGRTQNYEHLSADEKARTQFVQFHPSYDYSDFVEGLRPYEKSGTLGFKLQDGTFMAFVKRARQNYENSLKPGQEAEERKNFVFIIDEINRGEISKILGELFYSIEPDKRGPKGGILTQYYTLHADATEEFYIPENVYIIGTMNDIDRSVDTFDFAMRRRFRFIEIDADKRVEMLDVLDPAKKSEALARMKALNKKIEEVEDLGKNYQIGAAYYLKLQEVDFDLLWSDYLKPLLKEYVHGLYEEGKILDSFWEAYNMGKSIGSEAAAVAGDAPESEKAPTELEGDSHDDNG